MNANPLKLIRPKTEDTRQEKALRQIQAEHIENKWTPIEIRGKALSTDEILRDHEDRLARYAVRNDRIPLSRKILRFIERVKRRFGCH
jgi:hypothetical protein